MTAYTPEWLTLYSGQSPSRSADLDWHRHWWSSCVGDPEAAAFRRLAQHFPFCQRDVGTDDGQHDYPNRMESR